MKGELQGFVAIQSTDLPTVTETLNESEVPIYRAQTGFSRRIADQRPPKVLLIPTFISDED